MTTTARPIDYYSALIALRKWKRITDIEQVLTSTANAKMAIGPILVTQPDPLIWGSEQTCPDQIYYVE